MKATREEMKDEAVFRMKMIGLPQSQIDAFETRDEITAHDCDHGVSEPVSEEEFDTINHYEERLNWLVWAFLKKRNEHHFAGMDIKSWLIVDYHFLFVSDDPEKWAQEREELTSMEPVLFNVKLHYLRTDNKYNLDVKQEKYIKRRIQLNNDNSLELQPIEIATINTRETGKNHIFPTDSWAVLVISVDPDPPRFNVLGGGWNIAFRIDTGELLEILSQGRDIKTYNYMIANVKKWLDQDSAILPKITNRENADLQWIQLHR